MARHLLCAALGLLGLGVAACGGDDDASTSATSTTGATSAATTTSVTTSTAGAGGSAGGGGEGGEGGGTGGASPCTPVTLGAKVLVDTDPGGSSIAYELLGLDAAVEHAIYVEFFDVGAGAQATGDFDLGAAPDDDYATCTHCLLAFEDVNGAAPVTFYPGKGTLHVTLADTGYTGASAGTFEGVELVEVTLDSTVTTPVPGGRCLSLGGGWDGTQP